jgi:hypothetical protein
MMPKPKTSAQAIPYATSHGESRALQLTGSQQAGSGFPSHWHWLSLAYGGLVSLV